MRDLLFGNAKVAFARGKFEAAVQARLDIEAATETQRKRGESGLQSRSITFQGANA